MARTILFMGHTKDTKTSQLYFMAKWIYEKYGMTTRWINSDPGGVRQVQGSGLIEMGIVDLYDISNTPKALSTVRALSEGYWPRWFKNKETGEQEYRALKHEKFKTDWEKANIGMYAFDGLTSLGDLWLAHISKSEDSVGFKHSYKYEEGGYQYNGLQEGHYGLVQSQIYQVIANGFNNLPVPWVAYTAKIELGEDDKKKIPVYGPKGAGKAATPHIPSWVEDCIHLQRLKGVIDGEEVERVFAWFQNHIDAETDRTFLAGCRLPPELYPKLLAKYPKGRVLMTPEKGIQTYLNSIEAILAEATDSNKKWKEEVDKQRKGLNN